MRARRLASAGIVGALLLAPTAWADSGYGQANGPGQAGRLPDTGLYAPLDRPGPALSPSPAELASSLSCTGDLQHRHPVLLVPGTTLDPSEFRWNYLRSLPAAGFAVCTVALPQHALGDIQLAGEYVVNAIRQVHARSGQQVAVVGHSQGGMVPRWALRLWPDVRPMVSDLVGLAPSNHGTLDSQALCRASCPPAFWQQAANAHFVQALNSGVETFRGISDTDVYTHADEVVTPNLDDSGSSSLKTGRGAIRNVALQDVCTTDASDHLAIGTYDAVAYALVVDALTHRGPADPARVPAAVCTQPFQPGVEPAAFAVDDAGLLVDLAANTATGPQSAAEPPLASYTTR